MRLEGCASVLHDHNTVVVHVGLEVRFEHLLVRDEATETEKTAPGVLERKLHPRRQLIDRNGAKINDVPDKVELGDRRGINLNDGPITCKVFVAIVETDGSDKVTCPMIRFLSSFQSLATSLSNF